ncbi:MAG: hypothetical protein H7A25_12905 [Leptospiraceae bacterium]|nr:hypothetical protein [Leptospiraceae bacterium]MCP5500799.1 hypothetical protein [Leptospiraceae bacterium]
MEIIFYKENGDETILEISEDFYKWLALSDFSKIQKSTGIEIKTEVEEINIEAVRLENGIREKYISFFQTTILENTYPLILKLEEKSKTNLLKASSNQNSMENIVYKIKKSYEAISYLSKKENIYMEYL